MEIEKRRAERLLFSLASVSLEQLEPGNLSQSSDCCCRVDLHARQAKSGQVDQIDQSRPDNEARELNNGQCLLFAIKSLLSSFLILQPSSWLCPLETFHFEDIAAFPNKQAANSSRLFACAQVRKF